MAVCFWLVPFDYYVQEFHTKRETGEITNALFYFYSIFYYTILNIVCAK